MRSGPWNAGVAERWRIGQNGRATYPAIREVEEGAAVIRSSAPSWPWIALLGFVVAGLIGYCVGETDVAVDWAERRAEP